MSTHVDLEDMTSTRSEKVLAAVLAIFLLIGTGWFYVKVDAWVGHDKAWEYTTAEQQAIDASVVADDTAFRAEEERDTTLTDLELAREQLRLAIEQGEETADLRTSYAEAQEAYDTARDEAVEARRAADAATEAASAAEESHEARSSDSRDAAYWISALLRTLFVVALVLGSLRLMTVQRARGSRYLALGLATVVAAAVMALVLAFDYITDYVDLVDLGPLVLSALGMAATIAAFVALQRYLARRVPRNRVRKGECPFCGFPVRGTGPHCEGCGRDVLAECASCATPRRVGSPHCAACGTA